MNRYKNRRNKLISKIKKDLNIKNFSIVLKSNDILIRSNDTEHDFRQNSNFYYLTGITFADKCYFLINVNDNIIVDTLYIEAPNKKKLIWGEQLHHTDNFNKESYAIDNINELIEKDIYNDIIISTKNNIILMDSSHAALQGNWSFSDISYYLKEMRAIKEPYEINCIQEAIAITKKAFEFVEDKDNLTKKTNEYNIQADVEYVYTNCNVPKSFQTIAASGINATILHYISNNKQLNMEDLILIDTGCEYSMYASDITRTIPLSGKMNTQQLLIDNIIRETHDYILSLIKTDTLLSELKKEYESYIYNLLMKNNILKEDFKLEDIKKVTKHNISHHLGIDVHDVVLYKGLDGKELPLKEHNVITLEPGLYFNDKSILNDLDFYGIGIRYENDILVLNEQSINLSADIK
jgi:Xaa-Pro aminopeptidase